MDARTAHLIALVEGGATNGEAGRVYGLTRERVRQILKKEGVTGRSDRSEQHPPPAPDRLAGYRQLGPAAEALWRKGMLYREVADIFGMPTAIVRELVCERVPRDERAALIAAKFKGREVSREEMLAALREAAEVLGRIPAKPQYERLRGQGLVEGPPGAEIAHRLRWARACELAGFAVRAGVERGPSEHACYVAISRVMEMLGRVPTYVEYRAYRTLEEPTTRHICKHYGGWYAACERFLGERGELVAAPQRVLDPALGATRRSPEELEPFRRHDAHEQAREFEPELVAVARDDPEAARPRAVVELAVEIDRFSAALRAGGLSDSTVRRYLVGPRMFISWLGGDYTPGSRGRNEQSESALSADPEKLALTRK